MIEIVKDITKLKEVSEEFNFQEPPMDPSDLAWKLLNTMKAHDNCLGLSAIQIGISLRVFIMRSSPQAYACFNPRIVLSSSNNIEMEEGCMSFPGLVVKVDRPTAIKVRFAGPDGEVRTHEFAGMTARIFQHELDHLNGKLFFEEQHKLHLQRAIKSAKKRGFDYGDKGLLKFARK